MEVECDPWSSQLLFGADTPSGRMLFQMLGVFAEFERALITSRIVAGQARAKANGVKFGRPPLPPIRLDKVQKGLREGRSIRAIAATTGVSTATVQRVKRSMQAVAVLGRVGASLNGGPVPPCGESRQRLDHAQKASFRLNDLFRRRGLKHLDLAVGTKPHTRHRPSP